MISYSLSWHVINLRSYQAPSDATLGAARNLDIQLLENVQQLCLPPIIVTACVLEWGKIAVSVLRQCAQFKRVF